MLVLVGVFVFLLMAQAGRRRRSVPAEGSSWDGKGLGDNSAAVAKTLYHIDLSGATDISDKKGSANLLPFAVTKTSFLDLVAA